MRPLKHILEANRTPLIKNWWLTAWLEKYRGSLGPPVIDFRLTIEYLGECVLIMILLGKVVLLATFWNFNDLILTYFKELVGEGLVIVSEWDPWHLLDSILPGSPGAWESWASRAVKELSFHFLCSIRRRTTKKAPGESIGQLLAW